MPTSIKQHSHVKIAPQRKFLIKRRKNVNVRKHNFKPMKGAFSASIRNILTQILESVQAVKEIKPMI